ncbi:MAG TPA: ATP-binding protein [Desulfovibrio sp.]|uniref:ATP-binding protein n=1 Tax=Desulfovibrio sp. TaxID=885 RepID=UPI002B53FD66|nr:ATP-binding protein [Desulfovibrio sp.]HMM37600.1 ATP-binding protein [Desulfovibrio sp.]
MLAFIRSSYFQGLLDSFQTGVILFNDAGRAYAVNAALPRLLGLSHADLARTTWDAFFLRLGLNEDLGEYLEAAGPLNRPRELPPTDFDYLHPDGGTLRLSLSRSLLVDFGKLFGITVQIADMSDIIALHEREKAMLEENRLLQRHRAQGLQKLSMAVAHQIRNPLMTVGGFSDLLLRRLPEAAPETELVRPILDSARRLEAVVEAVSSFAAIRLGEVAPCALAPLAREALDLALTGLARAAGHSLDIAGDGGTVAADADLLRRALAALLRNSLEAADGPCRLRLSLEPFEDLWELSLLDDGPGVAEEHLPYVFDPFYSTRPLSVGMGLTTAQRIAHEHGGGISLGSGPRGGCLVRLALPRRMAGNGRFSP